MTVSYTITLPLPPSVNATHTVGRGYRDKDGKWKRTVRRSDENKGWREAAYYEYRRQFPHFPDRIAGRVRVDYTFIWNAADGARHSSDVSNREKILSDFFENKFYTDDNQIDEQHHFRRISAEVESCVVCHITEIPDRRFMDMFNKQETINA